MVKGYNQKEHVHRGMRTFNTIDIIDVFRYIVFFLPRSVRIRPEEHCERTVDDETPGWSQTPENDRYVLFIIVNL